MEEKDKWIQHFRDRMEDYSEPVPEDVWKQLERDLGVPKVVPAWRRWQAAAAIALVLLVSSLAVRFWVLSSADYAGQQPAERADLPESVPVAQTLPAKETGESAPAILPIAVPVPVDEAVREEALEASEEPQEGNNPDAQEVAGDAEAEQAPEQAPELAGRTLAGEKKNTRRVYARTRKKQGGSWSIALAAGNSPFSSTTGYGGYGRFHVPAGDKSYASPPDKVEPGFTVLSDYPAGTKEYVYNQILWSNLSDEAVYSDVEHKMPITFGASLRLGLNGKWSMETGVVYTMLSSDLRSGSEKAYYEQEQRLHYVGIPLKLNREIWNSRRLEVYASAGGTVEKCVSGTLQTTYVVGGSGKADESEDIKIKPLQWSLSVAAGAQFKLTDKLGVYAEPGMVYYFDDGSEVATIRKEHPFQFNIQLGVRFTLPK